MLGSLFAGFGYPRKKHGSGLKALLRSQNQLQDLMSQQAKRGLANNLYQANANATTAYDWDDNPFDTTPTHFRIYRTSGSTAVTTTATTSSVSNNLYFFASNQVTSTPAIPNPYAKRDEDRYMTLRMDDSGKYVYNGGGPIKVNMGYDFKLHLPDGSILELEKDGSYKLNDANAKIKYKACPLREFNPFVDASDKLEAFIKYCGTLGVNKKEMLHLPINLFIAWLIVEAAKMDKEPEPELEIKLLEDLRTKTPKEQLTFDFDPAVEVEYAQAA